MKEIEQIYHNELGLAFYWKRGEVVLKNRIQFIFKEMGFYLLPDEVEHFKQMAEGTINYHNCQNCSYNKDCQKILLKTPIEGVDLAVTQNELNQIKDLMEGAVFNLNLSHYIKELCSN